MTRPRIQIATTIAALALVAAPAASAGGPKVTAENYDFGPKRVKISQGERVTWTWREGTHTISFDNGFDEDLNSSGDQAGRRFKKPGTYAFFCRFHEKQGMKGKVVVR